MFTSQTTIYDAILIAGAILGCIICFFLWSMIKLHRRQLHQQKNRAETEILLLDQERTRIAADLHDELGPILSAAKHKMNEVEPVSDDEIKLLNEASDHIDAIITRIRQISNGLMPNTLVRKGPVYAIGEFIHALSASFPLKIEVEAQDMPSLPQHSSIHIYRILQEVIHNSIKHAKAARLRIRFIHAGDRLLISCKDNGIGFNKQKIMNEKSGLGLRNILKRVEMLNATFYIDTNPGKGTTITIDMPLPQVNNANPRSAL